MAHAGFDQYAEPVTAGLVKNTGEIEVRAGGAYIRMSPQDALALAEQLALVVREAIELATAAAATLEA
jgi:hypothetical protein